jgi:aspartate-semialdehyde dehydrogenase
MNKKYKVAVIGATGNVGQAILSVLHERNFPIETIDVLASMDSHGKEVSFGDEKILNIKNIETYDNYKNIDIAFFAAGSFVSEQYVKKFSDAGAIVIDNSSLYRMNEDVPLVIPEVNAYALANHKNIIANPNCSTIQLLMILKPLHDQAEIKRVIVSTYQSVSGAGREAMDELYSQTKSTFLFTKSAPNKFPKQIAFNIIPQIGDFVEDGNTQEELKIIQETKKILDTNIEVAATCVRVPVFVGHSEAVNIEFKKPISEKQAIQILKNAPGVQLSGNNSSSYMTPIECAGEDDVFVSRIRKDCSAENALSLWIVADNMKKGAALNAVQIAEYLIKQHSLNE